MKIAIAIIDGTGRWPDDVYKTTMRHSFCTQLSNNALKLNPGAVRACSYERGPSDDGYRVKERGQRAADYLRVQQNLGASRLILSGYSRGGSCAVFAAQILNQAGIDVYGMFLFDPVARHFTPGGEGIPSNVLHSYVALRSRDANLVKKYEDTIPLEIYGVTLFDNWANPMRPEFGNIDLTPEGSGSLDIQTFRGSHGGVGGVGWSHVIEDPDCQSRVASFANESFRKMGLISALKSCVPEPMLSSIKKQSDALRASPGGYTGHLSRYGARKSL